MALNVSLHFGPQRIFLEKGVFEFADATVTAAAFYISVLYIALGMQNIGQEIFGNVCVFMKKLFVKFHEFVEAFKNISYFL